MTQSTPKLELITERAKLVAGREQTIDILVRITPPDISPAAKSRPQLNLSMVLDRSGSMNGQKIARAREAASYCIDQLLPTDRVSVVIFDDQIEVLIPSQPAEHKAGLKETLSRVYARNSTALHEAWVRGGMQVSEHLMDGAINRVLLITDGLANVGVTSTDEIVSQAMNLFKRGVSTSTIGIGDDFNEDLLLPMAQAAGGNAWHVERADDMQRIFGVELEGLIAQFAHTVSMGMVPADGVRVVDVLNDFETTETGRYALPNLQVGLPLEVVVQLRIPAQATGAHLRLLDVRLGYTPQEARSAEIVKEALRIEFAEETEVERLPVNHEVTKAARLLMNARARREAMAHMDAGRHDEAQCVLLSARMATQAVRASAPLASSAEVQAECASLESLELSLSNRGEDKMSRKRLAYGSYARRTGKLQK